MFGGRNRYKTSGPPEHRSPDGHDAWRPKTIQDIWSARAWRRWSARCSKSRSEGAGWRSLSLTPCLLVPRLFRSENTREPDCAAYPSGSRSTPFPFMSESWMPQLLVDRTGCFFFVFLCLCDAKGPLESLWSVSDGFRGLGVWWTFSKAPISTGFYRFRVPEGRAGLQDSPVHRIKEGPFWLLF